MDDAQNPVKRIKIITIEEKATIIKKLQNGEKNGTVANEHGICPSTVSGIWKNKEKILRNFKEDAFCKKKKVRSSVNPDIEEALLKWCKIQHIRNLPINGKLLQTKANEFGRKMKKDKYDCPYSWIRSFKDRHNIQYSKGLTVNPSEYCQQWIQNEWLSVRNKYNTNNVFIMKKTGLYYKVRPEQTNCYIKEDCKDGNLAEERLTILLACNMTGSIKRKLLIIGNKEDSESFKTIENLPFCYHFQEKSWMTLDIFAITIRQWDKELSEQNKKIVLIIENCPIFSQLDHLKQIHVIYIPSQLTSILEPFENGIIKALKSEYRKSLMFWLIANDKHEVKLSILDVGYMLTKAWQEIGKKTINDAFQKAGLEILDVTNSSPKVPYNCDSILQSSNWVHLMQLEFCLTPEELQSYLIVDNKLKTYCSDIDQDIIRSLLRDEEVVYLAKECPISIPHIFDAFKSFQLVRQYLTLNGELTLSVLQIIILLENKLEKGLFNTLKLKYKNKLI